MRTNLHVYEGEGPAHSNVLKVERSAASEMGVSDAMYGADDMSEGCQEMALVVEALCVVSDGDTLVNRTAISWRNHAGVRPRIFSSDVADCVTAVSGISAIELASPSARANAPNGWDQANTIVDHTDGESGHSTDDQYGVHVAPPERELVNDEFRKTVE